MSVSTAFHAALKTPQRLMTEGVVSFTPNLIRVNPAPKKIAEEDKVVLTETVQPTKFSRKSLDC